MQPDPILDSVGVGICALDEEYRIAYANAALSAMLRTSLSDLQGAFLWQFVREDTQAAAQEYVQQRSNEQRTIDLPFQPHGGTLVWTMVSASRLTSSPHTTVCVIADVTERRQREDVLHVLAGTAEDHIFVINREDRVEYVNAAAARQMRGVPDQIVGRLRSELFPPEVADRQAHNLQHVLRTGTPLYVEGRTFYRDRDVWLSTWLTPVPDGIGGVRAVLGVSRDMTDRKRTEDALQASEQRLNVVLSNVPLVLWAADFGGTVTYCAGRALERMGASPDEIVGRTFEEVSLEPFPALGGMLRHTLTGESVNGHLVVGDRTFETWSVPLRNERHDIAGATGIVVDVTERLQFEAELSNANKLEALGRLAGGIAHDFNNNLTAILGYVDMMSEQVAASAIADDLKEVRRSAERAAGLVRRLLAFGRRQVLQPRSLDLNAVIGGLRPMLERLLGEHIAVDIRTGPDLRSVTGDAGELEHVIMNLALNARDAMPDGGTVTIETANVTSAAGEQPTMAEGAYVLMQIRDTGEGMAPHVKQHVFEPFFTTKPPDKGTGLGLSTVYGIVKQLNGFIWVESEVGRGTTFRVYLPALTTAVPELPATTSEPEPALEGRQTILLVEDEATVRRFARLALERHGFRVIDASTPEEALSRAGGDEPLSLLLTDVVMPRMSGPELAARLHATRPALPVLYMSGYPSTLVMPGGVLDPSIRLLSKPFTTAQLVETVRGVLRAGV